jgi:HemK-like putative methylase
MALQLPLARVTATDLSAEALSLAKENAARHSVGERIAFHEADLFPVERERFDWIVANLPYIASTELASLQREVRHDPLRALDGGRRSFPHSKTHRSFPAHLAPGGVLAMEVGQDHAIEDRASCVARLPRYLHQDYQQIERSSPHRLRDNSRAIEEEIGQNFATSSWEGSKFF